MENHVFDGSVQWTKVGSLDPLNLETLADRPDDLWGLGYGWGNSEIPLSKADELDSSLALVKLEAPSIEVKQWNPASTSVRAEFGYRDEAYVLRVTDPEQESRFKSLGEGNYVLSGDVFACIPLGEPYQGNRHKLVASLFETGTDV